ncbi:hypothetical protein BDZ89DRAFT_987670 [Hymenopellis radicata]|nr:hypothetical protein BDZ89DRAFT_987670 [Hymenopellis radicata]
MLDLPLDILPVILSHIEHPRHLFHTCLVNRSFYQIAAPQLYRRIAIYSWHKQGKTKAIQLFKTLSEHPNLSQYVNQLEIRDFPKGLSSDTDDISNSVIKALGNCINLTACSWTRDGSLNSEILQVLHRLPYLEKLEINGHDQGNYNPRHLSSFTHLKTISIIMPSASVIATFPTWFAVTGHSLTSLTLICKSSTLITEEILAGISKYLCNLDYFYITGCPKITHSGIWSVLSHNETGIRGLGLEGLSSRFDMNALAQLCSKSPVLHTLRSVTLTVHHHLPLKDWTESVLSLLASSPLEVFQIYSTGAVFESPPTAQFWRNIVSSHGSRLTRFSVHRMLIGLDSIEDICRRCTRLEQLFIVVEHESLKDLCGILSLAQSLKVLHINFPLEALTDLIPVLLPSEALEIVQHCSGTLTQLGCNTRVWQVERNVRTDEAGELHVERSIARYNSPDIPEQFLVVRT